MSRVSAGDDARRAVRAAGGLRPGGVLDQSSSAYERDTPSVEVVLRIARDRLAALHGVIGDRPFDTMERLEDAGSGRLAAGPAQARLAERGRLADPGRRPRVRAARAAELRERIGAQARRVASHYDPRPPVRCRPGHRRDGARVAGRQRSGRLTGRVAARRRLAAGAIATRADRPRPRHDLVVRRQEPATREPPARDPGSRSAWIACATVWGRNISHLVWAIRMTASLTR